MPDQSGHATATIEVSDRRNDRFPLGGGPSEPHDITEFPLWNIDSGLHASEA